MEKRFMSLTGNEAAAWAARLAKVRIALSFPMGPSAEVTETLQQFVASGETPDLKVIYGESEKGSSSMQIGVARLGVRSLLCINSEGILWAESELHYAASSRLPLLLVCPSRALEPPTTVYCDHDDFITQRDMGWLMFYCESPQDVFDTILQAYKIAEHGDIMLPAIVGYDGWDTSHASTRVSVPADPSDIDSFLPAPNFVRPEKDYLSVDWKDRFSKKRPMQGLGGVNFMDIRYLQKKATAEAIHVIEEVGNEYREKFGSRHVGLLETCCCEDAEIVLVSMGIIHPIAKIVVEALRAEGVKVGCTKLRAIRPFPGKALGEAIGAAKLVITLDRNSEAALYSDVKAALYDDQFARRKSLGPLVMGKVIGIGGAPITVELIASILEEGVETVKQGVVKNPLEWKPLRGLSFDPTREFIAE
ncbi:MAG: hypothetical protein EG826_15880 [Deltaproteobacteria bacterium]|nr:hypothetical protein [Deltaproteobacteria bacterium]